MFVAQWFPVLCIPCSFNIYGRGFLRNKTVLILNHVDNFNLVVFSKQYLLTVGTS